MRIAKKDVEKRAKEIRRYRYGWRVDFAAKWDLALSIQHLAVSREVLWSKEESLG